MDKPKTGDLVGSIIGNLVGIAIVNTVPLWQQWTAGVVTDRWVGILWAANLSFAVQIIGSFLLLFYRPGWFSAFMRAAFSAAGLVSLIVFYLVFPLDFSFLVGDWLNRLIKAVLILSMAVTLVVGLVHLVRFFTTAARGET